MELHVRHTSRGMGVASTVDDGRPWCALRRAARVGLALLSLVISIAACSVGSGGQPGPAPYNCVATTRGCVQNIRFHVAQGDLTGTPWAVSTSLLVSPMACDKACRDSSRDPNNPGNNPGYIANFMQVVDTVHGYFIRVGYSTGGDGVPWYFYESNLPETSFVHTWLYPTLIDVGNPTSHFIQVKIYAVGDGGWFEPCLHQEWHVEFRWSEAYPTFSDGSHFPEFYAPEVACSEFVPDTWAFGQNLYGKSGASAKLAVFTNNQYGTAPITGNGASFNYNLHFLTHDGTPSGVTPPPFADWTTPASASQRGGSYYTECCQALP